MSLSVPLSQPQSLHPHNGKSRLAPPWHFKFPIALQYPVPRSPVTSPLGERRVTSSAYPFYHLLAFHISVAIMLCLVAEVKEQRTFIL
jgi:hypothetical protein